MLSIGPLPPYEVVMYRFHFIFPQDDKSCTADGLFGNLLCCLLALQAFSAFLLFCSFLFSIFHFQFFLLYSFHFSFVPGTVTVIEFSSVLRYFFLCTRLHHLYFILLYINWNSPEDFILYVNAAMPNGLLYLSFRWSVPPFLIFLLFFCLSLVYVFIISSVLHLSTLFSNFLLLFSFFFLLIEWIC